MCETFPQPRKVTYLGNNNFQQHSRNQTNWAGSATIHKETVKMLHINV